MHGGELCGLLTGRTDWVVSRVAAGRRNTASSRPAMRSCIISSATCLPKVEGPPFLSLRSLTRTEFKLTFSPVPRGQRLRGRKTLHHRDRRLGRNAHASPLRLVQRRRSAHGAPLHRARRLPVPARRQHPGRHALAAAVHAGAAEAPRRQPRRAGGAVHYY